MLSQKKEKLIALIRTYPTVVVAFSGGVDSTLLSRVAQEALGSEKVLLVTATSSTYPVHELEESKKLAAQLKLVQVVIVSEEIDIPGFADNPPDRCYYCKNELFCKIKKIAAEKGFAVVFDGSNADDLNDFRPGRRAVKELEVVSPLLLAGLTKDDIRALSTEYGLSTAKRGSFACLASRFPYGERITPEKLDRVGAAEEQIRKFDFIQFRVRSHENIARLEFAAIEMDKAWQMRDKLSAICKEAGFTYACIDCQGYRTGAMNETLSAGTKEKALAGK